jgi:hypothetical protein
MILILGNDNRLLAVCFASAFDSTESSRLHLTAILSQAILDSLQNNRIGV